jgi:DNA invertase Pin-like site-specific DNA recombinase
MFQVCGAFAEFERSMIRQRIHAGLKRAVAQGTQLGRPRIDATIEKRIQAQAQLLGLISQLLEQFCIRQLRHIRRLTPGTEVEHLAQFA